MAIIDKLFDQTFPGLSKSMDLAWKRNQAITSNISNAETPQYRAVDLDFAGELERAFGNHKEELKVTNEKHMDIAAESAAHLVPDLSGATKPDGNNVDLDIQMGQMAYNSGKYSASANMLRKKLSILKTVVRSN